jgi:hypothetical protein
MYGLLGFKQKVHLDWGSKILLGLKQKFVLKLEQQRSTRTQAEVVLGLEHKV